MDLGIIKSRLPVEKGGWTFLWEGDALGLGRYLFDSWLYRFRFQDFPLIHFDIDGAVRLHETPALAWALTAVLRYVLERFPEGEGPWDDAAAVALLKAWADPPFFVEEPKSPEDRRSYFQAKLSESRDCRGLWLGYASACEEMEAYGEAEEGYGRALDIDTDAETLMERARARLFGGKSDAAVSDIVKALTREKSDWPRLWPEARKLLTAKKSPWLALETSLEDWRAELEEMEFVRLLEIFLRLSLSLTSLEKERSIGPESAELKAALETLQTFESKLALGPV